MIAIDTNILVYSHRRNLPWHAVAKAAIARLAEGHAPWGIPWPCIHEFLSVSTNRKIYPIPSTPDEAIAQVEAWMESPSLRLLGERSDHWTQLKSAYLNGKLQGPQLHDARIHAICRSNGVREFWSADRDFSRMRGLAIVNPCLG